MLGSYALVSASNTVAAGRSSSEYAVKAALLYNFSRFTRWPEFSTPNGHLNLCVIGNNPFGNALDKIRGKEVHGRTLEISELHNGDMGKCHIVFINRQESGRVSSLLRRASKFPVLTVSDMDGFSDIGGMIELQIINNKVVFYINVDAADKAGIIISSKLLRLAGKITGSRDGGSQ